MDGYGSYDHHRPRMEIVSGKGFGASTHQQHPYAPKPLSPNAPPIPVRASWSNYGGGGGGAAAEKPWRFGDPEMKRKKRIARYKAYSVEGKVKASLRRGIQWIKHKCSQIVNGY